MSIREFCRQRHVKESQFYWWQRKLKAGRQERNKPGVQDRAASFALVSEDGMDMPAGLELVLQLLYTKRSSPTYTFKHLRTKSLDCALIGTRNPEPA